MSQFPLDPIKQNFLPNYSKLHDSRTTKQHAQDNIDALKYRVGEVEADEGGEVI